MRTRQWLLEGGLILAACLLVAGAAGAQDTIKIGAPIAMSPPGSVAQGKEVRDGLTLAQEILNKKGGVLGRKIEILYEDHQGIPEKGRAAVEKLITRDKVVAITGEHASSVTLADIEVVHRYKLPMVNTNAWSDAVRKKGYPEVFNRSNYNTRVANAMAEVIAKMKVKNVVAFAENTDYGIGQAEVMKQTLAKAAPEVKFTYRTLDRAAKDFTPAVLPLKAERPDMVVLIMIPPAAYLLMNQLYENGVAPSRQTWLYDGAGVADYPEFWDNVKDAGVGLISFGLYHPKMNLTPLGKEVRELYIAKEKREPNRLIFQAADSLFILADAISRAKSTASDVVIKALSETRFEGSHGVVTFDKEPGITFQQWKDIPYVTYQLTARNQALPETLLIQGPGLELSTEKLMRPAR
jgi:branched-chain amino acid transport system substrate-binding protein